MARPQSPDYDRRRDAIVAACLDPKQLESMPVNGFMDLLAA